MFELLFSIYARSFIILCLSFLLMTYSIYYVSTRTVLLHWILPPFVLPPTPRHHHIHTVWWWSFSTPYISFHFIILYHQFLEEIVRIRVGVCVWKMLGGWGGRSKWFRSQVFSFSFLFFAFQSSHDVDPVALQFNFFIPSPLPPPLP